MMVTTVLQSTYVWLCVIYVCMVWLVRYSMAAPIVCLYVLNVQHHEQVRGYVHYIIMVYYYYYYYYYYFYYYEN